LNSYSVVAHLIEYIPLQQGLRHSQSFIMKTIAHLIEYIPLQQGLRHNSRAEFFSYILIEYIPLQQGLRQVYEAEHLIEVRSH